MSETAVAREGRLVSKRGATPEQLAEFERYYAKYNADCDKRLLDLKKKSANDYVQYLRTLVDDSMYQKRPDAQMELVRLCRDSGNDQDLIKALKKFVEVSGTIQSFEKAEDYITEARGDSGKRALRSAMKDAEMMQGWVASSMEDCHLTYDEALDYIRACGTIDQELMRSRFLKILKGYPSDATVWINFFSRLEPQDDVQKYLYLLDDWYRHSDKAQRKYIRENFLVDWKKLESEDKP